MLVAELCQQLRHVLRVGGHVVAVVGRQRRVAEPAQVRSDHLEAGSGERLDVALPDAARLGPAVDQQQRLAALARAVVGQRAHRARLIPLQPHGASRYDPAPRSSASGRSVWDDEGTWEVPNPGEPGFDPAPEELRARDAALPLGRAAHRPPQELHDGRRARPLPAPQRHAGAAPDGLRRLRPAGREPRDQDRRAPARVDRGRRSRSSGASSAPGASRSTGARVRHPRAALLPLDPVDLPEALRARPRLPQARAGQVVPEGPDRARQRAGDRRPLRALRHAGRGASSSSSGSSRSPTTPTACWRTSTLLESGRSA